MRRSGTVYRAAAPDRRRSPAPTESPELRAEGFLDLRWHRDRFVPWPCWSVGGVLRRAVAAPPPTSRAPRRAGGRSASCGDVGDRRPARHSHRPCAHRRPGAAVAPSRHPRSGPYLKGFLAAYRADKRRPGRRRSRTTAEDRERRLGVSPAAGPDVEGRSAGPALRRAVPARPSAWWSARSAARPAPPGGRAWPGRRARRCSCCAATTARTSELARRVADWRPAEVHRRRRGRDGLPHSEVRQGDAAGRRGGRVGRVPAPRSSTAARWRRWSSPTPPTAPRVRRWRGWPPGWPLHRRAALLLTNEAGDNTAAVVRAALKNPDLRRAENLLLVADLKAIPMEQRKNPAEGKDEEIEMEPLTPEGEDAFTFATGRLFSDDPGLVTLSLARQRLMIGERPAQGRGGEQPRRRSAAVGDVLAAHGPGAEEPRLRDDGDVRGRRQGRTTCAAPGPTPTSSSGRGTTRRWSTSSRCRPGPSRCGRRWCSCRAAWP